MLNRKLEIQLIESDLSEPEKERLLFEVFNLLLGPRVEPSKESIKQLAIPNEKSINDKSQRSEEARAGI